MVFLLAFVGMLCWGVTPLFVKMGLKNVNPLVGLSIRTTITIVILCIWMFLDGNISKISTVSSSAFCLLAVEAILATVVGDLAYFAAIKRGAISLVTIIMASSPLVTIICSIPFLGEEVTLQRILGAVLVIVGIIIAV